MEPPRVSKEGLHMIATDPDFRFYHELFQGFSHLSFGIEEVWEAVRSGDIESSELNQVAQSGKNWFYEIIDAMKTTGALPTAKITSNVLQKLDDLKSLDWTNPATRKTVYDVLETFKPHDYNKLVR